MQLRGRCSNSAMGLKYHSDREFKSSNPGLVVLLFLGKALYCFCASFHPGGKSISATRQNGGGNPAKGWHPIQGGTRNTPSRFRGTRWPYGECAGLWIERSGFEPWPGHCVVFMGKILYSHSAFLHPGVYKWVPENLLLG